MQAPACPQPSAPPSSQPTAELPHTRTRPVHWLTTATALAAVLGAAALVQPPDATATPPAAARQAAGEPAAGEPAAAPDAKAADYPLECGGGETEVVDEGSADLDGDGRPETAAVVRCAAGMGTPPHGVYVLGSGSRGGAPRVLETLVDPAEKMNITDFAVGGGKISATLLGYSAPDVPRCCPDLERKVAWHWRDGTFRLTALPVPGRV
ncbi:MULTISPECIES: hypothetical protein [Streptomyces]|uniref:hypothetical protein n=1 Tax=Streptomyces TaxID=1883 RepID=UPI001D156F74|nr:MULTISPECIES: hypothetical protein [Streptomyces]MCC3655069.1 hypothetical protein [Streptomyces sp. S07_1.15]WSQ70601.1 hypothetical protein OG463_03570 [Streptomyces xinghaiensis]